jgi:hypothetical protein
VVHIKRVLVLNPGDSQTLIRLCDRTGTSNTGKNYINGKLATPEEWSSFYMEIKEGGADGASGSAGGPSCS